MAAPALTFDATAHLVSLWRAGASAYATWYPDGRREVFVLYRDANPRLLPARVLPDDLAGLQALADELTRRGLVMKLPPDHRRPFILG